MKKITQNSRGMVLVVVIMLVALLLSLTGAGLLFSGLNLKSASNFKTGGAAIHAADAGIQHALALIPEGSDFNSLLTGSVTGFTCASPCDGTTNKPTLTGSLSGYTYTLVTENDADGGSATNDTNQKVILLSTATGPNNSKRAIKGYVVRSSSSWAPPGALYIPGSNSNQACDFSIKEQATITGSDYNVDGTAGSAAAVPGIATNSDMTTQQVKDGIRTPSNVTGAGGTTPNVATATSPVDINALANSFLTQSHANTCSGTTFGTWAAPQITYCSGEMRLDQSTSGAGVLIVDGKLRIEDSFNFKGIIITRGGELRIEASGSSTIYGAILISPAAPEIEIEGNGAMKYSSQAIQKVQDTWPGVLSRKAKLIAWHEVMQ